MLSTSNKSNFQYQYLLVAVVIILAMASVIALYQSGVLPTISVEQAPATVDLSWPPRPDFSHLNENAIVPVTGSDSVQRGMEAYSARYAAIAEAHVARVSAFHDVESARWMGAALASQAQGRNVESARWMGAALASQATEQQISNVESARWMGAALASQTTEQQIRDVESARWMGAALASQSQEMSFHYTWPGR